MSMKKAVKTIIGLDKAVKACQKGSFNKASWGHRPACPSTSIKPPKSPEQNAGSAGCPLRYSSIRERDPSSPALRAADPSRG